MKRVIDGKLYNTETATHIGADKSNHPRSDFNYEDTSLYVTAKGAFFIAGQGGALSRWCTFEGNCRSGGEGIQALTTAEALQWAEENELDADVIQQYFEVGEA